jgi:hypothetical protein
LRRFYRRVSDLLRQDYNGIVLFTILFSSAIIITDTINHRFSQTDFRSYVQAAEWLLQGENLYSRIEGVAKVPYKYSPFAAFFFTPFLLFSLEVSKVLYFVLNASIVLLLIVSSSAFVKTVFKEKVGLPQKNILTAILVLAPILYRELHVGNVNGILAFLIVTACLPRTRKRESFQGVLLCIAVLFKPHYVVFAGYFLFRKRWRLVTTFFIGILTGFAAPMWGYGFRGNITLHRAWYQSMVAHNAEGSWVSMTYGMNNIFEVLSRPLNLLLPDKMMHSALYPITVLVLLAGAIVYLAERTYDGPLNNRVSLLFLMGIVPMLGQVDTNHFILVMPLLLFFTAIWRALGSTTRAVTVLGMILIGGNIYEVWGKGMFSFWYDLGVYGMGTALLLVNLVHVSGDNGVRVPESS